MRPTYFSRKNARIAAEKAGVNMAACKVVQITEDNRGEYGLKEEAVGRYVYIDRMTENQRESVERTIRELDEDRSFKADVEQGPVAMPEEDVDPILGVSHPSAGHARYMARMRYTDEEYELKRISDEGTGKWLVLLKSHVEVRDTDLPETPLMNAPVPRSTGRPAPQSAPRVRSVPNTLEVNRSHSTVEKPVARVHRIASEMVGAPRKDVIARCVEEGVNIHTAKTQYQVWSKRQRSNIT